MNPIPNSLQPVPATSLYSKKRMARNWFILISIAILVSYLYAFLEWFFFITQPSYTAVSTNAIIQVTVLFFSGFIIAAVFSFTLAVLFLLLQRLPPGVVQVTGLNAGRWILAFLIACLSLLLIDNFTYTIFKIGIVNSTGMWRAAYTMLFASLLLLAYKQCAFFITPLTNKAYRQRSWVLLAAFSLVAISMVMVLTSYLTQSATAQAAVQPASGLSLERRPNIIIIGSDGVNAASTSLYGYSRETTPTLTSLASQALLVENAFHNGNTSTGSTTSLLTGKLPTTTRVVYPPDILLGDNATEHLPGILKQQGYRTVEIALPHYVDAFNVNFQQAFDLVNGRSVDNYPMLYLGWKIGGDYPAYFIGVTAERIFSRLKHIFFIQTMENPYDEVTTGFGMMMTDQERIDQLIALFQSSSQPLFAHVHLMGTHGPLYYPVNPYYSQGKVQTEPRETDFYDDAIRDFDAYLAQLMAFLQESGLRNNTIVVIYSDHGKDLTFDRVPLVFIFPHGESAGVITANAQNLDVAPTLLDYLGLPIPTWMEGDSLFSENLTLDRDIFIPGVNFSTFTSTVNWDEIDTAKIAPPFFQFGKLRMIVCDKFYQVDLTSGDWSEGQIPTHTAPCDPATLPTMAEARQKMLEHLASQGFDVSILQD